VSRLLLALVAGCPLLLAACGDDDTDVVVDPTLATSAAATASPTLTASPEPTSPPNTSQSLDSVIVTFHREGGDISLNAEVADSPGERQIGLMNRETLGEDAGMLFVWPEDTGAGFWMQNTLIPLTIAFIRADGTIIAFADMEPQTTDLHHSPEPYRYAIEANKGWFEANEVKVGIPVDLGGLQ
jgi:uncharacterized membrane protein (UPF0127 family)